jgi:hypothetical protein
MREWGRVRLAEVGDILFVKLAINHCGAHYGLRCAAYVLNQVGEWRGWCFSQLLKLLFQTHMLLSPL